MRLPSPVVAFVCVTFTPAPCLTSSIGSETRVRLRCRWSARACAHHSHHRERSFCVVARVRVTCGRVSATFPTRPRTFIVKVSVSVAAPRARIVSAWGNPRARASSVRTRIDGCTLQQVRRRTRGLRHCVSLALRALRRAFAARVMALRCYARHRWAFWAVLRGSVLRTRAWA